MRWLDKKFLRSFYEQRKKGIGVPKLICVNVFLVSMFIPRLWVYGWCLEMTSFEKIFVRLKEVLEDQSLYETWPDFEGKFDVNEYFRVEIGGLPVLMLHCASCEGPHSCMLG